MMNRCTTRVLLAFGALVLALPAVAAEHEVKMLNKGADNQTRVFEPAFLKIAPGDTVRFVPTDKSHNAESIPGMLPEGAQPFKGKLSQEIAVTFEKPGIYGFKCTPHVGMGMVGLVQVGDDLSNLEAAKAVKVPGFGGKRMSALFEMLNTTTAAK